MPEVPCWFVKFGITFTEVKHWMMMVIHANLNHFKQANIFWFIPVCNSRINQLRSRSDVFGEYRNGTLG